MTSSGRGGLRSRITVTRRYNCESAMGNIARGLFRDANAWFDGVVDKRAQSCRLPELSPQNTRSRLRVTTVGRSASAPPATERPFSTTSDSAPISASISRCRVMDGTGIGSRSRSG